MSARERILSALPRGQIQAPEPWVNQVAGPLVWEEFQMKLEALGGIFLQQASTELWQGPLFVDGGAGVILRSLGVQMETTEDVWTAETGVTLVEAAVAETGSLVLSTGKGRHRLASLAPPRHVAIVRESQLVRTLDEAVAQLDDRTSVLVTGPSRTADIAGILVRGIHGPKELFVLMVPD